MLAAQALAQVPLPPVLDPGVQMREEERRREELERLQRKPVTDPLKKPEPEKPAVKAAPDAVRFQVREIEITPSEILTREELEGIARDYRGKELSLADLQQLAARINALYRAKGVVTAQAVIPPQDVSGGIVRVRLVEGRVGKVRVEGNANTNEDYIRWRIDQAPGRLVDLDDLERKLIRFNRTTDAQLRAELKPGETFGTTDLNLTLYEPPRHNLRFSIDNGGSPSTGQWRQGLTYVNRSLLGWRDDLVLSANRADGYEGYSASYGLPFNRWGGRATFAYYKDYTEIVEGPTAPLGITGESEAQILTLRQPAYVAQTIQLDLTGGGKKRTNGNWISGVFLQSTKTEDVNLGAELQLSDRSGYWLANYSVTAGHAYVVDRRNYSIGRGTLRRSQELGRGLSAIGSIVFQHTDDDLLPSSEQFFIGGEYSVRGYPPGTFAGDQGYTINVEVHHPLYASGGEGSAGLGMTGFFFADSGYVKPFRPPNSVLRSYERLSSLGWGLNASIMKRVSTRLTFAYALNDLPLEPRRYEVHFQIAASLF